MARLGQSTLICVVLTGAMSIATAKPWEPLLLADFERGQEVSQWKGVKVQRTDDHATSGKWGMRLVFPRSEQGQAKRAESVLAYQGGKGYVTNDWSEYGDLVCDAWNDGATDQELAMELRDANGGTMASTPIRIEPGQPNRCRMPLRQPGARIDLKQVEAIVFFAPRPTEDVTIIVDNLRLEPSGPPPLATIALVYPNYRGLILPGAGPIKVQVDVAKAAGNAALVPASMELSATPDRNNVKGTMTLSPGTQSIELGIEGLPTGPVTLMAKLLARDGKTIETREWQLRKLTPRQVGELRVYIDRHNNTIVDGKPFFPLGWYGSTNDQHLEELIDSPFNCLLNYGTNEQPRQRMLAYLDKLEAKGLKLIYCLTDVHPAATTFDGKDWEGAKGNDAIVEKVVKTYRDHPAILAWYLNDELPRSLVPKLEAHYQRIRALDPSRPCYIVLCDMPEVKYFPSTTDVMGVDPYPIPKKPVTVVSDWMEVANAATRGHMPTWLVPQAFAWYQYKPEKSNRARIPSEKDLREGRAPTYEEERCMTYLALAHGAKGLIYYCYYDLRVLPQYKELWAGLKKIGAEVKTLSPVLLSPDDLGPLAHSPETAPIHTRLKRHEGSLFLIAVNAGNETVEASFRLKGTAPQRVDVLFENRAVTPSAGSITDTFKPLEVHVYRWTARE